MGTNPPDENRSSHVGFVLLSAPALPDRARLVGAAAERGMELVPEPPQEGDSSHTCSFAGDGLHLLVTLVPTPHPDAATLADGATSPDRDAAAAAPAHLIVGVFARKTDDTRVIDARLAKAVAAVVAASDAIGAMLGHGRVFHRPELFHDVGRDHSAQRLPVQVCVDLTVVSEPNGMVSVLTHGLERYGREDLLVFSRGAQWQDGCNFAWSVAAWMLNDPAREFPTGDSIGRDASESVKIERGKSPIDDGKTVVVLRLPAPR